MASRNDGNLAAKLTVTYQSEKKQYQWHQQNISEEKRRKHQSIGMAKARQA